MSETDPRLRKMFEAVAQAVIAHADELTELDSAIGDGDHGHNMTRGMQAVLGELDALVAKPWNEALKAAGMQLVMKVGGASGPLYGTLVMTLGKSLDTPPTRDGLTAALHAAIEAVMARGKASAGQKTMLDVLVPVSEAVSAGRSPAEVAEVARKACAATKEMLATKGRASFLGERSVGHIDPGARSSQIMIEAIAEQLGDAK
ncbi:dihydroxyacetone kinase subunit DhaL [Stappia indica]|uniref:Dihydroxyacetone kinase DhaL subunit n=1 Tax=Stappia indica TaxID=538381 RepID=A0A285SMT5_9HYPH|nr:dihydroxyacetone kinase subunit DhaL [Stappia indica]SOC07308.1 dihydroxyacetone kinase DhaL subunit [Stappia indica]